MNFLAISVFALLPLLLTSCGSFGRIPTQEQIAQIHQNKTTEQEALAVLGKPESVNEGSGNKLYKWSFFDIVASEGQVHFEEFQILTDSSGLVRKKNYCQSTLHKDGYLLTETYSPNSGREPSTDQLPRGITGKEAEQKLGPPLSRTLRVDGGLDRTWVTSVKNVYLITNVKPKQVIGHFTPNSDRLNYAETKR